MKHMLMLYAVVLLGTAMAYLVVAFSSSSDDGTAVLVLPIVLVSILTSLAILEADRRLRAMESRIENQESEPSDV